MEKQKRPNKYTRKKWKDSINNNIIKEYEKTKNIKNLHK